MQQGVAKVDIAWLQSLLTSHTLRPALWQRSAGGDVLCECTSKTLLPPFREYTSCYHGNFLLLELAGLTKHSYQAMVSLIIHHNNLIEIAFKLSHELGTYFNKIL